MNTPQTATTTAVNNTNRKLALGAVTAAVLLAAASYGAYWMLVINQHETTDNAYVQGNLVQITPQLGGTVLAVGADETDYVKAGQLLVKLDQADAQVALEQAEAQLAQTVREVRTLFANNEALQAQIALREADLSKAKDDLDRRKPLLESGAVGREEFNHADTQLASARSELVTAKGQLAANRALTDNTTVKEHPNVQRAAARVSEAYLALKRVEIPAPVDGYVAKRTVQVGQRIQSGQTLMTMVALDQVWVDANFKEGQLQKLRIGQPATLVADVYGKKVEYHGTVAGLGAGTGSAFALLPAQNATGNWIKIVQRVPVRISLKQEEVRKYPLRVGLSMAVEVDVSKTDGKVLADIPSSGSVAQTSVFGQANREADDIVRRIIAANLGRNSSGKVKED